MKAIKILTGLASMTAIGITTSAMCSCSQRKNDPIKHDFELSEFQDLSVVGQTKGMLYLDSVSLEANKSYTFKIDTTNIIIYDITAADAPPTFSIAKNTQSAQLYSDSVSVQYIHNNKSITLEKGVDYTLDSGHGKINLCETSTTQQLTKGDVFYITLKVVNSVEKYTSSMTFKYE